MKRNQIFNKFSTILEQRIKLEYEYAQKLKQISSLTINDSNSNIKNHQFDNKKPSDILLNTLIRIIEKQSQNRLKLAKQMEDEVMVKVREELNIIQKENKKNLALTKSLKKDIDNQLEMLEKHKNKFYKKSLQLQKLKLDYVISILIQDRDFEKKNKLFIKIKQMQNQNQPLKRTYQQSSTKYNQILSIFTTKITKLFKKLQDTQLIILNNMKNSIINSLLFHSAYGAILVHETQVVLSFMSEVKTQNTQIKIGKTEEIQNQTNTYQNNFSNPSQYVDDIFKKIEENKIEQIIKYGQSFQYRSELSNFFEKTQKTQPLCQYKHISDYTIRIIQIFKTVFQGEQYSSSILIEFSQLIKAKPHLRKDFILCLQKYRLQGKFQIHKNNFDNIIKLINLFLDICCQQLDTYNSKQFMVLSFTYYFTDENGQKVDLQHFVKSHKIWHNIKWWECSLLESIYQEHKFKNKKNQLLNTITIWDIKCVKMKKNDTEEDNSTISNICFNQLTYYVHNMQLFEFKNSVIMTFAQKYIKIFSLSSRMADDIMAMCKSQKKIPV